MNNFDKAEEIMERYRIGLIFPYHINHELKQGNCFYSEDYTEFHEHDFHSIVLSVYEEPKAFYLTENDMKYYSEQELEVIEKIKE